jgi:hypothetical protein
MKYFSLILTVIALLLSNSITQAASQNPDNYNFQNRKQIPLVDQTGIPNEPVISQANSQSSIHQLNHYEIHFSLAKSFLEENLLAGYDHVMASSRLNNSECIVELRSSADGDSCHGKLSWLPNNDEIRTIASNASKEEQTVSIRVLHGEKAVKLVKWMMKLALDSESTLNTGNTH